MTFLELLRKSGRRRMQLQQVRVLMMRAHPELRPDPEADRRLLEMLERLAQDRHIGLPAVGSWQRIGAPAMPKWISIMPSEPAKVQPEFGEMTWVPELGFWTELAASRQLEAAARINEFLLVRRRSLGRIPIKERSLQIFGDEKRLDQLRSGDSLFAGRLPLAVLGAFVAPLPLPYRPGPTRGMPLLVVENHDSYWSLGEWNQAAAQYSAVVYGQGHAFASSGRALRQTLSETGATCAEYLGDIDPAGIAIPTGFCTRATAGEPTVIPAVKFYEWLLKHGARRPGLKGSPADGVAARQWLGSELGGAVEDLWMVGARIPQESLGLEILTTEFFSNG